MAKLADLQTCQNRHRDYPDLAGDTTAPWQAARLRGFTQFIPTGATVLDVGCNSGYMVELRPDCKWSGIDINPHLVETAVSKGMDAIDGVAEELPYPDQSFDVVVLAEILEHVFDPDRVVSEAVRVSRGLVIGSTPQEISQWGKHRVDAHLYHVRAFNQVELLTLLEPYGRVTVFPVERNFYCFKVEVSS